VKRRRPGRRELRAIDLFCGAGGSSWGAKAAGVNIVAAFDRWSIARETHKANFPQSKFFGGRLENVRINKVKKQIGKIDLILASPECTNHSPAKGSKPRCETSKNTAFQVVRFARAFKPRWIVVENVVSMSRWSRFAEFKRKLEKLGYKLREEKLNSLHFGVAQSRRRLFLLCDRKRTPLEVPGPRLRKGRKAFDVIDMNGTYNYSRLGCKRRAKPTLKRANRALRKLGRKRPFLFSGVTVVGIKRS